MPELKYFITKVQEQFEKEILSNETFSPSELYDPIKYILSNGGKRIRAVLVLIGANFFGDPHQVLNQAIGIEIFHNFTLLHDDIMDNAPIRRGNETVHVKWDENTAILSGDAMVFLASQNILKDLKFNISEILSLYNKTALEVCEGQQLDMNLEALPIDSPEINSQDYLEMIKLKTSVLIACCLKLGALAVGASDRDAQMLYEYGLNIGLAFQLQDDLLDSFGNEETFGKKIGGDILEGKKTYLFTQTLELISAESKQSFFNSFSIENESDKIAAVKKWYVESGAKGKTIALIDSYFSKASAILNTIQIAEEKKFPLIQLTESLQDRKS